MRHDHGSVLPPEVLRKMHSKEVDYFKQYDKVLAEYMGAIDLDLTSVRVCLVSPTFDCAARCKHCACVCVVCVVV